MVKEKKGYYLSPKRVLDKNEYKEYVRVKQSLEKAKLQKQLKGYKKVERYQQVEQRYGQRPVGKISRGATYLAKTFGTRGGLTSSLYRRSGQLPPQGSGLTVGGQGTRRRGRPTGSYDRRYAAFGGVYGYRKQLTAQLRIQKLQAQRQANISPQQQVFLNQLARQEQARQMNPEGRIVPSTSGQVPMEHIFKEIDEASNIFS